MASDIKPEWISAFEARNLIQQKTLQPFFLTDKILEDAVMRGNVEVMGMPNGSIIRRIVTLDELEKCEMQGDCLLWRKPMHYALSSAFGNLVVDSSALRTYLHRYHPLPLQPHTGGARTVDKQALENDAGSWMMVRSEAVFPIPRKDFILKEIRKPYPKLSRRAFERVWAMHAPNEWKTSGPRSA